jgi:hypothetical protein
LGPRNLSRYRSCDPRSLNGRKSRQQTEQAPPDAAAASPVNVRTGVQSTTSPVANKPFDPDAALLCGEFIGAAYAMHAADPANVTPAPSSFPAGYQLEAWIAMRDFVPGETGPKFYGFICSRPNRPRSVRSRHSRNLERGDRMVGRRQCRPQTPVQGPGVRRRRLWICSHLRHPRSHPTAGPDSAGAGGVPEAARRILATGFRGCERPDGARGGGGRGRSRNAHGHCATAPTR